MELMQKYDNLAGDSGVTHYSLLEDGSMVVVFKDESVYVYPEVINKRHILNMVRLARAGRGLATYISREKPIGARCAVVFGIVPGPQGSGRTS
jgi:hypothetical protein